MPTWRSWTPEVPPGARRVAITRVGESDAYGVRARCNTTMIISRKGWIAAYLSYNRVLLNMKGAHHTVCVQETNELLEASALEGMLSLHESKEYSRLASSS